MNKIITLFAITLLQSSLSLAQGIGDISIEPKNPSINQPFKITINSNGDTPACGLQINLGDGTTRDIRVEKFPVVVDHTYAKEGNFAIAVNGKMIMRGLSSMFPCAGDAKNLAVGVGTQTVNAVAAQPTPQSTANITNQSEQLAKPNQTSKQIDFYSDHKKNQRPTWVNTYFDAFTENVSPIIKNCPLNDTWAEAVTINKDLEVDKNLLKIQIVYKDIQNNIVQDANFNRVKQDCRDKVKIAVSFLDANKPEEIQKRYKNDLDDFNKFSLSQQKDQQRLDSARSAETEQSALKETYTKGMAFAKESGVVFKLYTAKDQMTNKESQYAMYVFKNEQGQSAEVIFKCEDKTVSTVFKISSISVPTKIDIKNKRQLASGRSNINGSLEDAYFSLPQGELKDFYLIGMGFMKALEVRNGALYQSYWENQQQQFTPIHSMMIELKTYKGGIVAKIPPYDSAINSVIRSCK